MKTTAYILALATAFVGLSAAQETVVSSGTWYSFPSAGPQDNGPSSANGQTAGNGAFWDNISSDGTKCNIGFVLTGTQQNCGSAAQAGSVAAPGALTFLGGATQGTPAPSFYFTPGGSNPVSYVASYAGYTTTNSTSETFGFAYLNDLSDLNPIFSVSNGVVTTDLASFTPTSDFVFYLLLTPQYGSQVNPLYTSSQSANFALFSDVPAGSTLPTTLNTFFLGMDDISPVTGGDRDYQDVVAEISVVSSQTNNSTPEPGFYGFLALGLSGLGFAIRRRQTEK